MYNLQCAISMDLTWTAPGVTMAIHGLGRLWRLSEEGRVEHSPLRRLRPTPAIFAFWHSRGLASTFMYRYRGIRVLVSPSRDGEWLTQVVGRLGFGVIRGSTRQGPVGAVRQMVEVLQMGSDIAITPDGPLGPPQQVQPGVVYVAKQSGCPIIPFSFDCHSKWVLKSWDRFIVPKPFSRGVFTWGEPLYVKSDASESETEGLRGELESRLNALTDQASRLMT